MEELCLNDLTLDVDFITDSDRDSGISPQQSYPPHGFPGQVRQSIFELILVLFMVYMHKI